MTTNQPSNLMDEVPTELKRYVQAMKGASGLTDFHAITSVLFAIATHIDFGQYPILVYLGPTGTGKTVAMKQLLPMCKEPKRIGGNTYATQRDALRGVRTAFVDEADWIDRSAELTKLYNDRFQKETGTIEVNRPLRRGGWGPEQYDIFGATVMAKRASIGDVGLRNRCIVIRTRAEPLRDYHITQVGDVSAIASNVAAEVIARQADMGQLDRVMQTWSPVFAIGEILGMNNWRQEAFNVLESEASALKGAQGYEPSEAILGAINILARDNLSKKRVDKSVNISDVVRTVSEEYALTFRHNQIEEEARAKGFDVSTLHGYRVIKVKKELLDGLLSE